MTARLFFDLDGTLTDPFIGISRSICYALDKLDVPIPSDKELRSCIGPPLIESFRSFAGDARAEKALQLYRERFADIGWQENHVYTGIDETLRVLSDSRATMYVATSKPRVYAQRIVEHFGLTKYFDRVFGSELDGTRNDKTDLLRYALAHTDTYPTTTMIGDRAYDITGARNNGLRAIGVAYGYGSREELMDAGAEAIAERPTDILPLLGMA